MAARRPYRMTPARKAAIRKAQVASARKRKGSGKGKPVSMRRRAVAASGTTKRRATKSSTSNRKRNLRRIAVASAAVGTAAGTAYVYKNREKLVISKVAEYQAVKNHQAKKGRKLTKAEKRAVRLQERKDHASRSTYRVREYLKARNVAQVGYRQLGVSSLRPDRANSLHQVINRISGPGTMTASEGRYMFMAYRRDVHSRALQRHARMTGKKRKFNYDSGKRLKVSQKGVVTRTFW